MPSAFNVAGTKSGKYFSAPTWDALCILIVRAPESHGERLRASQSTQNRKSPCRTYQKKAKAKGEDVSDWLNKGGSKKELIKLAEAVTPSDTIDVSKFQPLSSLELVNFNEGKGADMVKVDLAAVGIPYQDEAGRYADFHALRHSFISGLDHPDISVKVAQSLARHSSVSLTLDTYTHPKLYSERAALEKLPRLPNIDTGRVNDSRAVAFKTGTDDLPVAGQETVYEPVYKKLAKNAYSDTDHLSSIGNPKDKHAGGQIENGEDNNILSVGSLGTDCNTVSPPDTPSKEQWAGLDSNQRRFTPTGLQPVPFSHSGTDPYIHSTYFEYIKAQSPPVVKRQKRRFLATWPCHTQGKTISMPPERYGC